MSPRLGDHDTRAAVFAALTAWLTLARSRLGSGLCLIGGGFVSAGEASEHGVAVYVPTDEAAIRASDQSEAIAELVTLRGVIYSYPGGGGLRERWSVSGLLDTHVASRITERTFRHMLAALVGPDGFPVPGVVRGYVEVEVNGRD